MDRQPGSTFSTESADYCLSAHFRLPILGLPTAILKWHRVGLADTRALELSQALFDVAGVFTNRFQRPTDIITHLWRAQLFDMQCQLHQGSFQGQLVGVHRRLVWINKDKVEFIRTVLEGYPFPEIYIAAGKVDTKTGEGAEMLVDGQQRITTLYQYFKGSADLRLPADVPRYEKLPEDEQVKFLEYKVVVRDLGNMSIDQIKQVLQRINSTSYGLNAMEIHNARYGGEFKKTSEQISQLEFFEEHRIFTSTDVKRMNDTMYCASLLATTMSTHFNRDSEVEVFLEKFNEHLPNKDVILKGFDIVLSFIDRLNFAPKARIYKKADFFTLFIELHKLLVTAAVTLDLAAARYHLEKFFELVDIAGLGDDPNDVDAERYYKAALQASNDRGNRIARGEIINKVLRLSI